MFLSICHMYLSDCRRLVGSQMNYTVDLIEVIIDDGHACNILIYCDVTGSPCLSKKGESDVWFVPWPRVLSLPERFIGDTLASNFS